MRTVLRVLCWVVLASTAISVWTRAALLFVLGPQLTSVCLWTGAAGSLCAIISLAGMRKPARRQQGPPEPASVYARQNRIWVSQAAEEPHRQGHSQPRDAVQARRRRGPQP